MLKPPKQVKIFYSSCDIRWCDVCSFLRQNFVVVLGNGAKYDVSYYYSITGSRMRAIGWYGSVTVLTLSLDFV